MENFMDMIFQKNLYLAVPMGAFFCYFFLMLCFLNISGTPIVRYLRIVLLAFLMWSGGAVLMRLQISPGIPFWYHVSLMGLFIAPIGLYGFLFYILDISNQDKLLYVCLVISVAAVFLNAFTGCLLPPPEVRVGENGVFAYIYHSKPGLWIWFALEISLFVYATWIAYKKIKKDKAEREKLEPLFLGVILVFAGNILCVLPDNAFPYDTLGGVGMAICIVYIIYKQYLFETSFRIITGAIYFVAVVVAMLPIFILTPNLNKIIKGITVSSTQFLLVFMVMQCIWVVLVLSYARKRLEHILYQKKKHMVDSLVEFQDRAASVLNKTELYQMIRSTVANAITDTSARIFELRDGHYVECLENGTKSLSEEKEQKLCDFIASGRVKKYPGITFLKYDDISFGFIYVELHRKNKLNYGEADCIRQIGNSASGTLKNIDAYERIYQVSVHDELTGLYNRYYGNEYAKTIKLDGQPLGVIYLDIDNFKLYNELYGEKVGDEVLCWSAKKIREVMQSVNEIFRVGANEFLIIVSENDREKLLKMAENIQKKVLEQTQDKPKTIQPITFSIGIAWYPGMAQDVQQLLHQARRAAFYAKGNGKNRIEVYEKDLDQAETNRVKGYEQVAPTVFALMAAVDAKDSYTFEHSGNVSDYAVKLAIKLGLPKDDIHTIKEAGLLHDIGKIGIPERILQKTGKLTDEEYAIMKTHVENSIEMIHYLPNMNYVIPAVVSHHERYDGKGYPQGLKGEEIPLMGRILAVCDSFDAMISKRAYKEALSVEYALGELERNKGTQFDPDVAQAFIELVRDDPTFFV